MSMEVDLNTPLTREERDYLQMRGRLPDIERADSLHDTTAEDTGDYSGDGTGPMTMQLGTAEQQVQRREQLLAELRNMGLDVEVKEAEPEADEDVAPPYETWKSADLNAEIDRRNEGRADGAKISKAGSVSERADRLYVDDEQQRA